MHGEVLLRQCCGLQEGDKHRQIFTHKHTQNPGSDGSVVVMASLTENNPSGFALINKYIYKIIRHAKELLDIVEDILLCILNLAAV